MLKKKIWAKNLSLSSKKYGVGIRNPRSGIRNPRSGIRKKNLSRIRVQGSKMHGSRIRIRNTDKYMQKCSKSTSKDILINFGERKMWVGKTLFIKLVLLTRIWVRSSVNPLVNWIRILLCPCKKTKKQLKILKVLLKNSIRFYPYRSYALPVIPKNNSGKLHFLKSPLWGTSGTEYASKTRVQGSVPDLGRLIDRSPIQNPSQHLVREFETYFCFKKCPLPIVVDP